MGQIPGNGRSQGMKGRRSGNRGETDSCEFHTYKPHSRKREPTQASMIHLGMDDVRISGWEKCSKSLTSFSRAKMPLRGLGWDKHQLVSVEIDSSLVGTCSYLRNMMSTQIKIRLTRGTDQSRALGAPYNSMGRVPTRYESENQP